MPTAIDLDEVAWLRSFGLSLDEIATRLGVRRASVIAAACALLVHGEIGGSEVVLDFPVSRRVRPEALMVPGMISGVVPLVLKVSAETTVAGFCEHVDKRIQ